MAKLLAPPTKNAVQKTLAAQLLNTAASGDPITFDDVDGLANLPGTLVINRINSSEVATPEKREYIEYSGTSGNTVLITTRNVDSSNDALTHAIGSVVEFIPDVTWADRMYDALATLVNVNDISQINSSIVTLTGSQTLTNKIISGGHITGATLTGVALVDVVGGIPVSDGGAFVYPTQFEKLRVLASNASVSSTTYTELEANASVSAITSGHGDIVLTPATNKLVKVAVLEQDKAGANTYRNNSIILTGWGVIDGTAAGTYFKEETVTFGVTFSTTPIVIANSAGRGAVGAGALSSIWSEDVTTAPSAIGTTSFKANVVQSNRTNLGSFDYVYTWIAIGTL